MRRACSKSLTGKFCSVYFSCALAKIEASLPLSVPRVAWESASHWCAAWRTFTAAPLARQAREPEKEANLLFDCLFPKR
jgi:hypothetical protein